MHHRPISKKALSHLSLFAFLISSILQPSLQPTLAEPISVPRTVIDTPPAATSGMDATTFDTTEATCKFNRQEGIIIDETLIVDGLVRKAIVHLPAGFQQEDAPLPLVLVLHGAKLSGKIAQSVTGFDKLSNTENFIVAYPDAVHHQWNDGRREGDTPSYGINDVKFMSKLMDYLIWKYNVNPKRIYMAGYSSGGMLSQKFGMEMSERVAAIAPVASSIPLPQLALKKKPSNPLPVLMINGTNDAAFPWEGGTTHILGIRVGPVAPVLDSVQYWIEANGGLAEQPDKNKCENVKKDGTAVDVTYYPTRSDASVLLYKVNGGGHTWPGSEVPLRYIPFLGRQSNDLSASELIWNFFQPYTR